jgi:tripartite-type tricarboxylate transporter receptor subunit TctC
MESSLPGKLLLAVALLVSPIAWAQSGSWPAKPVRFIVPVPPGGSIDTVARLAGAKVTAGLGQQVIVDNRPGGSGTIGTAIAAKSPADGYTFLFVANSHAINASLIPNLPYDTLKDFAPVMLIGTTPFAVATAASKPYRSFDDVAKAARAKPATLTYGSIGPGSTAHLFILQLQQTEGFKMVHVPYKGGGPMTVDAMGGHVELAAGSVALLAPHVRTGKLRGLAVTGDKRSQTMPDVPTLTEQGIRTVAALSWWGVLAPAGVPPAIINRLHAELAKAFDPPDVRKQLAETLGMDTVIDRPEALQKYLSSEIPLWRKVIRDNNVRAD